MSHQITQCVETGMSDVDMDMFLLGLAAVLTLTLVEMIEDRKRKEFIIKKQACEITRLYNENHALENKAQEMVRGYEYE